MSALTSWRKVPRFIRWQIYLTPIFILASVFWPMETITDIFLKLMLLISGLGLWTVSWMIVESVDARMKERSERSQ